MTGSATYRIQFSKDFRFSHAQEIVPFLRQMGVSELYASPILQARSGSAHGYDVTDPTRISDQLGGEEEFSALVRELQLHGMGLLVDIVPNHMAVNAENRWWLDVLENGSASHYGAMFSVQWHGGKLGGEEKVYLPILGEPFGAVLEKQQFQAKLDAGGLFLQYWERRLPIDPSTYRKALQGAVALLDSDPGLSELLESFDKLPARSATDWDMIDQRLRDKEILKQRLFELYTTDERVCKAIDRQLQSLNGVVGDSASFLPLERLLHDQPYRLAFWKTAREKINYRRFFDVTDLISIRAEDPQVFETTHKKILELVAQGAVTGLRIDHIDGLFHPREYLERLQQAMPPGIPVVVEKILLGSEQLPCDWKTAGTTGYDFLANMNGLFVDPEGLARVQAAYGTLTGVQQNFRDVAYANKKLVINDLFSGEMARLGVHLGELAEQDRHARDISPRELSEALLEATACFAIYRTYIESAVVRTEDRACIHQAVANALERCPKLTGALGFVRRVLLLECPPSLSEQQREEWLQFVMRWQQLTGPIMAKGVEDTSFYVYVPVASLNEVGSDLQPVSVERFHEFQSKRGQKWPGALNATATHDTKRGEDARARLNVLSEIADDWVRQVTRWQRLNASKKPVLNGQPVPDANDEYLLYQTLLAGWPNCEEDVPAFRTRISAYIEKLCREAKTHSSWLYPNGEYEQAFQQFAMAITEPDASPLFWEQFHRIRERVSFYGAMNSLSQVTLKATSPGIPDFYQGSFTWDLSLVDPDNRRPVEYERQMQLRQQICEQLRVDRAAAIKEMLLHWPDGRVKLFTTRLALGFRQKNEELMRAGTYLPLTVTGERAGHVFAFARRWEDQWSLTAVPRLLSPLSALLRPALGGRIWRGTAIELPEDAPKNWQNTFTCERIQSDSGKLLVADVFCQFPVAICSPV